MDRDFIIGMILIFVILFGWQYLGPKPAPEPKPSPAAEEVAAVPAQITAAPGAQTPTPADAPAEAASASAAVVPVLPPVELEGENVSVQLTNVGARIASWRLKKFNDVADTAGKPLEMVSLPESGKLPMATYWVGSGPRLSETDTYEIASRGPDKVVFVRNDPAGFRITKTFEPDPKGYSVALAVEIESLGPAASGRLSISSYHEETHTKKSFFAPGVGGNSFVAYVAGDVERVPIEKSPGKSFPGNVIWAGFESIYFLSAIAPEVTETTQVQVLAAKAAGDPLGTSLTLGEANIPAGGRARFAFNAFLGPKAEKALADAGHNFDQSLDFGWFTAIAKFLVGTLHTFFRWTGNWGVAIIIVTVIIRVLLFPLTQKSYKSMKSMSVLQPEMQKIRERYKDDRDKMNQEMMALYRAHGVNPASGCLPMLLQLPIFLAFYRALYGTIELRHAPFALWIHDLSAPDPFYVLPIVMGVTMVVTQKMTPSTADPIQNKIMMLLPVMFTVMFLGFPSGLVLYWMVSNLLSIAQQVYLKRSHGAPPGKKAVAA